MRVVLSGVKATQDFAAMLGRSFRGGEVLELVGDVGSGKTTFTKGLAAGLGVDEDVQSPTFTISRVYTAPNGLTLHHYDFYRLPVPGIMAHDLAESTQDDRAVTVIEWGETVADVLPPRCVTVQLTNGEGENERIIRIDAPTKKMEEAYVAWTQNR